MAPDDPNDPNDDRAERSPPVTEQLDESAEASTVRLPAGDFRILTWPGGTDGTTVFLHGLSGAADVWRPTIAAFGSDRPRCIAIDQRGHGLRT